MLIAEIIMKKIARLPYFYVCLPGGSLCRAERIKDIVDIGGVRSNPLSGVGLVMGLTKTGDSAVPSRQMLTNILKQSGLVFQAGRNGAGQHRDRNGDGRTGAFRQVWFTNRCYRLNNRRCGEPSGRNAVSHSAYRP